MSRKRKSKKAKKSFRAKKSIKIRIDIKTRELAPDIIECLPECTMRRNDQCGIYNQPLLIYHGGKKEQRIVCHGCKWLIGSIARHEKAQ